MAEILVQMENVLNIAKNGKALPESLRTHVGNLAAENHPIVQASIHVMNLTTKQCNEAMDVVPEEDIWNLSCWGCRDTGHSMFTCPYIMRVHRIFFAYLYLRRHAEANPLVAK